MAQIGWAQVLKLQTTRRGYKVPGHISASLRVIAWINETSPRPAGEAAASSSTAPLPHRENLAFPDKSSRRFWYQ